MPPRATGPVSASSTCALPGSGSGWSAWTPGGLVVDADSASIEVGRGKIDAKGGHLELSRGASGYRVHAVAARELNADVTLPAPKAEEAAAVPGQAAIARTEEPSRGGG